MLQNATERMVRTSQQASTGRHRSKETGSQTATQAEAQLSQTSTRPQVLRPGKKEGEGLLKEEVELDTGAETLH